jgi:hypothetical protein
MKHCAYILLLLLTSCANTQTSIDPKLRSYVEAFARAGNFHTLPPLTVQFGNGATAENDGECIEYDDSANTPNIVNIVQNYWDWYNETQRTLLMFHELGHCVLHRVHNNALNTNGMPVSIMYYVSTASEDQFNVRPLPYLLELFHPSN